MRKSQVLVVAVALLFCSAVAVQAQGVYEVFSNPVMARTGGARELAGDVVLFLRTGSHASGEVTVRFSAPLAEATAPTVNEGTIETNVKEGTVTITMPSSGEQSVTLTGVRLDLREAEAPVTAMFSGDSNAFLSGAANVVSAIGDALEVKATMAALLTRGDAGMATVTVSEAFAGALKAGSMVVLTISGVPDKATLMVSHAGYVATTVATPDPDNSADVAGAVTINDVTIVDVDGNIVDPGDTEADMGTLALAGDAGKDIDIMITFAGPAPAATEKVTLALSLDSGATGEGMVSAMATMAPTKKPDEVAVDSEYFTATPTDAATVFTFAPASCTLLFPYVVSLPEAGWNTGLAITNPTAGAGTALGGTVTFTLFANGGDPEMPMTYTTGAGTPGPNVLDDEGMLAAGSTYTLLLSELLAWVGHTEGNLTGHLYVETNFTGCRGVGWVTDFATVNQAYLPYFADGMAAVADVVPASN